MPDNNRSYKSPHWQYQMKSSSFNSIMKKRNLEHRIFPASPIGPALDPGKDFISCTNSDEYLHQQSEANRIAVYLFHIKKTMFTGLVETIGSESQQPFPPPYMLLIEAMIKTAVSSLTTIDSTTSLSISECADILSDASLGDSISVNGTCLTITEFDRSAFTVGVAPETLRRTNLGSLQQGGQVNLERSVSASTRMGGHFVQGHVDTVATIVGVVPDGDSLVLRLRPREKEVLRYIVEKGYVALDGASLTVTKVHDDEGWFEIMLIAYTQSKVVTAKKREGDEVNVEIDMVGKYVEKSVRAYFEDAENGEAAVLEKMVERIVAQKIATR